MSVWLTIPSARPSAQANPVLQKWRDQGYKIALYLDSRDALVELNPDGWIATEYPGYAVAVNRLIAQVVKSDPQAEWFVIGGDDVLPDPTKRADEIATECREHFYYNTNAGADNHRETFGVMQPTGDRWGINEHHPNPKLRSAYIDRICGSAWIGREFAERVYSGNGPLWPEFQHMFVDEHLQRVAEKLGVLWQRPDLTHHHQHWARGGVTTQKPAHLEKWSGPAHWKEAEAIFKRLEAGGFKEAFDLA